MTTSPGFMASIIVVTSGPKQSGACLTFLPSSSPRRLEAGAMVYLTFFSPLGRPRWEASTTFAPCSIAYLIVGTAPAMRVSSVMLPLSSWGTLKSTLMKTFLSFISLIWSIYRIGICISSTVNLMVHKKKRGKQFPLTMLQLRKLFFRSDQPEQVNNPIGKSCLIVIPGEDLDHRV